MQRQSLFVDGKLRHVLRLNYRPTVLPLHRSEKGFASDAEVAVIGVTRREVNGPPVAIGRIHQVGMPGGLYRIPPRRMLRNPGVSRRALKGSPRTLPAANRLHVKETRTTLGLAE